MSKKKKRKEKYFTYCSLGGTSGGAINKGYVEKDRRNSFVVSKNDIINLVKACDSETTCIKYLTLLSNNDRRNMAGCHGSQLDIIFNLFVILLVNGLSGTKEGPSKSVLEMHNMTCL